MKTQIIHLDPHDDIISARDKMGWSQTARILLVWPEQGRVLNRRIDLELLHRHSTFLGAQLALVTNDSQILYYADELGIPTYNDLKKAKKSHWRVERHKRTRRRKSQILRTFREQRPDLKSMREAIPPKTSPWLQNQFVRLAIFTLGVLALLSIAAILLPSAKVLITPKTSLQEVTLSIVASPETQDINLSGAIPAIPVNVVVEGRNQMPVSGTTPYSDQFATGRVTFTNLTEEAIRIPESTFLRSTGSELIRYQTTEEGDVSSGPGTTLTIPVRAMQPGSAANLPAGSSLAIEGPLGLRLSASNPLPISGGNERSVPAPSQKDREEIFQRLESELSDTAVVELRSMISPDDILLTSTLTLTKVLAEEYYPDGNQPADQLSINLRLEYQALAITHDDLLNLANRVLEANMLDKYSPVDGTLEINSKSRIYIDRDGNINWKINAQRLLKTKIAEQQIAALSLGLTPSEAVKRLSQSLALNQKPQIAITPDWWPRLPLLPFRIRVEEAQAVYQ